MYVLLSGVARGGQGGRRPPLRMTRRSPGTGVGCEGRRGHLEGCEGRRGRLEGHESHRGGLEEQPGHLKGREVV